MKIRTISNYPLLIGELLARAEARAEARAKRRRRIRRFFRSLWPARPQRAARMSPTEVIYSQR